MNLSLNKKTLRRLDEALEVAIDDAEDYLKHGNLLADGYTLGELDWIRKRPDDLLNIRRQLLALETCTNRKQGESTSSDGYQKYSVLLLYPSYIADEYGKDTFYDWVEALSISHAVSRARIDLVLHLITEHDLVSSDDEDVFGLTVIGLMEDCHVSLVTHGYNYGLAVDNL